MRLDESVARRFWAKVAVGGADECWDWKGEIKWPSRAIRGSLMNGCYGAFYIKDDAASKKKRHQAHRIAWALTNGEPKPGLCVCHSCDNPRCCNPRHLWLGTVGENNRDRHAKGRSRGGNTGGKPGVRPSWNESALWREREQRKLSAPRGVRGKYAE